MRRSVPESGGTWGYKWGYLFPNWGYMAPIPPGCSHRQRRPRIDATLRDATPQYNPPRESLATVRQRGSNYPHWGSQGGPTTPPLAATLRGVTPFLPGTPGTNCNNACKSLSSLNNSVPGNYRGQVLIHRGHRGQNRLSTGGSPVLCPFFAVSLAFHARARSLCHLA